MTLLDRTFLVAEKGLKGKNKVPTVIFANPDGEKLVLKFDTKEQLDAFKIDSDFDVKISEGGQNKLDSSGSRK